MKCNYLQLNCLNFVLLINGGFLQGRLVYLNTHIEVDFQIRQTLSVPIPLRHQNYKRCWTNMHINRKINYFPSSPFPRSLDIEGVDYDLFYWIDNANCYKIDDRRYSNWITCAGAHQHNYPLIHIIGDASGRSPARSTYDQVKLPQWRNGPQHKLSSREFCIR